MLRTLHASIWPMLVVSLALIGESRGAEPHAIQIDGDFADWREVPGHSDPVDDVHDTDTVNLSAAPSPVRHPDVDILEFKVTHDAENLYVYYRAAGIISRTRSGGSSRGNRYYINVGIDVDRNDSTGFHLGTSGYRPDTNGVDYIVAFEWYNGTFRKGAYGLHNATDSSGIQQTVKEVTDNKGTPDKNRPYPIGFVRLGPGKAQLEAEWVYHNDDTITMVGTLSPTIYSAAIGALSQDGHEVELKIPLKGFLKDSAGRPIIGLGQTVDIGCSLEASGELSPDREWGSDTGEILVDYTFDPPSGETPAATTPADAATPAEGSVAPADDASKPAEADTPAVESPAEKASE